MASEVERYFDAGDLFQLGNCCHHLFLSQFVALVLVDGCFGKPFWSRNEVKFTATELSFAT